MIVELINFHVIIKDHDMFDENLFNLHTIFYDDLGTEFWEVLLAEVRYHDS